MSDADFPSGQWAGFYTYAAGSRRYPMDLMLEFSNGVVSGEGADGIGSFGIRGRYDSREMECSWAKTYVRRHTVEYTGYREQKGIWGTWVLPGGKGGFHIWPIGDGAPLDQFEEGVEEEPPLRVMPGKPLLPAPILSRTHCVGGGPGYRASR